MKIILLQNIKSLGNNGDIKEVSDGYARNFLFPKKLAEPATESAILEAKTKKEEEQKSEQEKAAKLKEIADGIGNKEIVIFAKEKKGKLFGSIAEKEIVLALKKEGLELNEKAIIIKEAIKKIGIYKVQIKLSPDTEAFIRLNVKGE